MVRLDVSTPANGGAPSPPRPEMIREVAIVRRPSSGTEGFFQTPPALPSPFLHRTFQRTSRLLLSQDVRSSTGSELAAFGEYTLSAENLRLVQDAETTIPRTEALDSFGRPKNVLITSEGWRALTAVHHREGLVASGFENKHGQYDRLYQFLKANLWSPSSGGVTCPAAMQDGAATLIKRLLQTGQVEESLRPILQGAFERLTSRDPARAWTSGQWMTERPGGSDVRETETRAVRMSNAAVGTASDGSPLGPWSISGFKWFSSATDADMSVLLSKTDGSDDVSLFFLPVRKQKSAAADRGASLEFNGITIQRLKNKLGTKSLPTAELILNDARGYLLGEEGQGTKEISTVLNITRIHNAVGAVSAWSRALAVSTAFSRVRRVGGKLLMDTPLHVRGLAQQTVSCHAHTLITFFVVALLGRSEHPSDDRQPAFRGIPRDPARASHLLRLLTPMLKATTAARGIEGVRFGLESLGGVGYLENSEVELNLAKLLRDTQVLSIWEGTADVQAMDTVRILAGKNGGAALAALDGWVRDAASSWRSDPRSKGQAEAAASMVEARLSAIEKLLSSPPSEVVYNARAVVDHIAAIGCTVMLVEDALSDNDEVAWKMVERWVASCSRAETMTATNVKEAATWDRRIVFDVDERPGAKL